MPVGSDSRVLVTGAAGHLGANLVRRLLADGHRVRVLLRAGGNHGAVRDLNVDRAYGDLRRLPDLRAAVQGCSHVYHCAAKVSTIDGDQAHQRAIFDCNVIGTRNVLEAARDTGVSRVVVSGSFSAVGYQPDAPCAPSNETMPFYPMARTMPYERSKVLAEHECLKAVAEGQDVVIATCCAVVGGNDFLPSRLGQTLCDYANGKLRAYIHDGGFEFVAARDIVTGHLLCMHKGRAGQKYIFSTEFLNLDAMLDLYEQVSGITRPHLRLRSSVMLPLAAAASAYLSRWHPRASQRFTPGAIRLLRLRRHADISKARSELGYRPSSIRAAVEEAYAFHYARGAITNPEAKAPLDSAATSGAGGGTAPATSSPDASNAA